MAKRILATPGAFKISSPGYDVDVATGSQLLMSLGAKNYQVVAAGMLAPYQVDDLGSGQVGMFHFSASFPVQTSPPDVITQVVFGPAPYSSRDVATGYDRARSHVAVSASNLYAYYVNVGVDPTAYRLAYAVFLRGYGG